MKIKKIKISNYRSINNLTIDVDNNNNFISFAGANNVGKTNVLNALALFFDKLDYKAEKDSPNHKFYGTRGGHWQPKVEIDFSKGKDVFKVTKDWNLTKKEREDGKKLFKVTAKKGNVSLTEKKALEFLSKVNFFYLQSINISFPDTIKYIMNSDIIELETGNTRMSGRKKDMKQAIEKVLSELQVILDSLGENITPLLEKYKSGWGVAFDLPKEINTFRDLMIAEVDYYIKDKSDSKAIDAKGAGLQRLAHILMHFRIMEKINEKKKTVILAIDEPDVYLHPGLQKILLSDIKKYSEGNQIFVTTHSPVFIDTVKLSNVFLLRQKVDTKKYQRAQRKGGIKEFNAIATTKVDLNDENGISTLKNYLGIEDTEYLLFDKYNILVEGEEDKIYLSRLMESFNIQIPNIIPVNGADNFTKYLSFYDSMATEREDKVSFLVLMDNDKKGREVQKKIKEDRFNNIKISKKFIISFFGFNPSIDTNGNCNANIEIEDFLNPEIVIYLLNKILSNNSLRTFSKADVKKIGKNIQKVAFQNNGILALLENEKNNKNPDEGISVKVDGDGVKSGMAGIFQGLDKNIIELIGDSKKKENENIYNFLKDISTLET